MATSSSLVFKVNRSKPELVVPSKSTPYELKYLSVIDSLVPFRIPVIQFYRNVIGMEMKDPVMIIKEAVAKALVYYFPFAGRLREGPDKRLMIECTGEGVLLVGAHAKVRLDQFGDVPQPPFPGLEHLLYDGPGSGGVFDSPLMLIQVTRLMCGGFIVGIINNHAMSDATGLIQFMTAIGEMARGEPAPSVEPVWKRDLLTARDPPQTFCINRLYEESLATRGMLVEDTARKSRSFFVNLEVLKCLKSHLPLHLQTCTMFDVVTAFVWRCRTVALGFNPNDRVGMAITVDARTKFNPPMPVGYYGNCNGFPVALSFARDLCQNSLGYAVDLVQKAKADVSDEFMRASIDLVAKTGMSHVSPLWYIVSDVRRGFREIDFGWGKAVYGGVTWADPKTATFVLSSRNNNDEENGVIVTMNLPPPAMETFTVELEKMTRGAGNVKPSIILSPL